MQIKICSIKLLQKDKLLITEFTNWISFLNMKVSQGNIATYVRYGEMINNHLIANFSC